MSAPKKFPKETVVVLILLVVFVACFLWIVIPNFIKARTIKSSQPCINNLRQIESAANQFAIETGKKSGDRLNFPDDLTPYIILNENHKFLQCPDGGIYILKKVGDTPTCSLGQTITNGHIHILP